MVQKMSSTTTKYRVVFNASRRDDSKTSLNDHLMVGPVIQRQLFDILVKFRTYNIAGYCADITKMYRQILVHSEDRKYQRILWRSNQKSPIFQHALLLTA